MRDKRKLWTLRDIYLSYQVADATYPVLTGTIDGGPEHGRRVFATIDPATIAAMLKRMLDEAHENGRDF